MGQEQYLQWCRSRSSLTCSVWNEPALPVMPWHMTFVFLSTNAADCAACKDWSGMTGSGQPGIATCLEGWCTTLDCLPLSVAYCAAGKKKQLQACQRWVCFSCHGRDAREKTPQGRDKIIASCCSKRCLVDKAVAAAGSAVPQQLGGTSGLCCRRCCNPIPGEADATLKSLLTTSSERYLTIAQWLVWG